MPDLALPVGLVLHTHHLVVIMPLYRLPVLLGSAIRHLERDPQVAAGRALLHIQDTCCDGHNS